MIVNVCVTPNKNETIYGLVNRFNKEVDREGILKDYKLSKMRKRDRILFKKFANDRRIEKQLKRVSMAIGS
jgi:hypothetical protein